MHRVQVEVCVNSLASALAAQEGGADRVELCDNILEGGTTPSLGMMEIVRRKLNIGLHVLIRPRGGDFLYSRDEYAVIKKDVNASKQVGVNGVVIGFLTADGKIDRERTEEITRMARPMSVTFHRAFDMCRDAVEGLETLIEIGVDRVLTSGLKNKAEEGAALLAELRKQARGRIIVMPGSGIDENNIGKIHRIVKASEYHVSLRKKLDSLMSYRRDGIFMGGHSDVPEYSQVVTDAERVRAFIRCLETSG